MPVTKPYAEIASGTAKTLVPPAITARRTRPAILAPESKIARRVRSDASMASRQTALRFLCDFMCPAWQGRLLSNQIYQLVERGRFKNTCPIDAFITALCMQVRIDPTFSVVVEQTVPKEQQAVQVFLSSLIDDIKSLGTTGDPHILQERVVKFANEFQRVIFPDQIFLFIYVCYMFQATYMYIVW